MTQNNQNSFNCTKQAEELKTIELEVVFKTNSIQKTIRVQVIVRIKLEI